MAVHGHTQHNLDRVRRPRVQITYDVYTGGALEKKHLPFVVGILADLSGQRAEPLKPLRERDFTEIDRDNFNSVLAQAEPRVAMKVEDKLTGKEDSQLAVELNFKHMDDFDPDKVAAQVPALNELLKVRDRLTELLGRMDGNNELEELLTEVLSNTEKAQALAKEMGVEASSGSSEETGDSEDGDSSSDE